MSGFTGLEGMDLRVGDVFTLDIFRPRWWQFWKRWPFVSRKPKTYRVVDVATRSTIYAFEE